MQRSRKFANPFYALLLIAGIAFALTATAYGVMAFREVRLAATTTDPPSISNTDHPLMVWMNRHGEAALAIELGLLAVCVFAAIATDDYWQRRARAAK